MKGVLSRWLMRFEASNGIISLVFRGITAGSTFTAALALIGLEEYVAVSIGIGLFLIVIGSFGYVETNIYNHKNRYRQEKGNNFAKPQNIIDDVMIARAIKAIDKGETLTDNEREIVYNELIDAYNEYRNGVDISGNNRI